MPEEGDAGEEMKDLKFVKLTEYQKQAILDAYLIVNQSAHYQPKESLTK
jgi:hypothetical protein